MPNQHFQAADNGETGGPQADTRVRPAFFLLLLQQRVEELEARDVANTQRIAALEARLEDVLSIAAVAYDAGRSSGESGAKPPAPETPAALRLACQGSGPAVDVKVTAAGVTHTVRVTPGVTDADAAWASVLKRNPA